MRYHINATVDYVVEAENESDAVSRLTGRTIPFVISRDTIINEVFRYVNDESPSYLKEDEL
jgi:hypothetical protein